MFGVSAGEIAPAAVYLLLFVFLILRLRVFSDNHVSRLKLTLIFLAKVVAIPVFYVVYESRAEKLAQADAGKFVHDARVLSDCAYSDTWSYLKVLTGLQDDRPGSREFESCLVNTYNWDNGPVQEYRYNDNRVVIRLHSILDFAAFGSYFVHALFSCFISFLGFFFLYRALGENFPGRGIWLLLVACLLPSLWFHTGAPSKEALTIFVLGCGILQMRQIAMGGASLLQYACLSALLLLSVFLKPYLLFTAFVCFGLYFLPAFRHIKLRSLVFLLSLFVFVAVINVVSLLWKDRSVFATAGTHRRIFAGMAKGGIFLTRGDRFLRLEYDTTLVKRAEGDSAFTIRKGVPYSYFEDAHNQDTLYCTGNQDTVSVYRLAYVIIPGSSSIPAGDHGEGAFGSLSSAIYYSLFYPNLLSAEGFVQHVVAMENLLIALSLLLIAGGIMRRKQDGFLPLVMLSFALLECLLIGYAAPNMGAIFRYRAPAVIFILFAALYYLPVRERKSSPVEIS
jgi:hypothetical protein